MKRPIIAGPSRKCRFCDILCFCRSLSLPPKMVAKLSMNGYAPGQIINVQILVKSQNGDAVCKFNVQLNKVSMEWRANLNNKHWFVRFIVQQIQYHSRDPEHGHEHKEKEMIVRKTVFACIKNESQVICVELQVPSTIPPTNVLANNIINVTYHIRVRKLWTFTNS